MRTLRQGLLQSYLRVARAWRKKYGFMYLFMNLSAYVLKSNHQNSNAIVSFLCWVARLLHDGRQGGDSEGADNYKIALLFW